MDTRRVTLLLSSVKGHRHWDVLQVLRKQHDEEDGPETETCHTLPGSRGHPEQGCQPGPALQPRRHPAGSGKEGCSLSDTAGG